MRAPDEESFVEFPAISRASHSFQVVQSVEISFKAGARDKDEDVIGPEEMSRGIQFSRKWIAP